MSRKSWIHFISRALIDQSSSESLSKWVDYHASYLTQTKSDTIKEILKSETLFDAENLNGFSEHILNMMFSFEVVESLFDSPLLPSLKKDEIKSRLRNHIDDLSSILEPLLDSGEISWKECEVHVSNAISEVSFCCSILKAKSRFHRSCRKILLP